MRLRTSFFDWTVFRKDIVRFAPLWGIYFIGGMMALLTVTENPQYPADYWAASVVAQSIGTLGAVNLVYAGLVAQLLFGDLFNPRLCSALHAMPLRREGWFITHLLAGVCYSLVPNAVGISIIMLRMGQLWYVAPVWLLGVTLQYLFFFGLAVFSVFCTGKRFAAVAVYAILNFGSLVAQWFCETIFIPMLYGVVLNTELFEQFCPFLVLGSTGSSAWLRSDGAGIYEGEFDRFGDGWGYLTVLAVIGVVLLAVSLLMYRRRKLERAGDFIAVKPLGPVFAVAFTLCAGAIFAMFGRLVNSRYVSYLLLGMVVGWFAAQMLLQRTVKVFRIKAFVKLGVLLVAMAISVLLIQVDAFNIVGWVPAADSVQSVTVTEGSPVGDYVGNLDKKTITLTSLEDIKNIRKAHKDILARREENAVDGHIVELAYKLKIGLTVRRSYWAPADGDNDKILEKYFSTLDWELGYTSWEAFVENVTEIYLDSGGTIPEEYKQQILEAIKRDQIKGYVFKGSSLQEVNSVTVYAKQRYGQHRRLRLAVLPKAEATVALLEQPEIMLGYTKWQTFLVTRAEVLVGEESVDLTKVSGLLEALRADCENKQIWTKEPKGAYCTTVFYTAVNGKEESRRRLYVGTDATNTITWLQENMPECLQP